MVAVPVATSHTPESPASSPPGVLAATKSRQQAIERSEVYQLELKKQLKWIWHTMDVNPVTCCCRATQCWHAST